MATFTALDQEKLAEADKHEQRKANTLGSDKSVVEEPFGSSEIVLRADIFSETPTASTNFVGPDYGDWPLGHTYDPALHGAVASRRIKMRLHPLVTSGMTGPSSIQTFLIVSAPPASDRFEDIEAVRIKHLVPPDLSPGRTNAADPNPQFRGFELALFPAQTNPDGEGNALDAYDGYAAIPVTADPTAANGIGDDARWTVDYANGIVRFSGPPLNGPTGLMNPFSVYGDINGQEVTKSNSGRITMFATFYQYTGPILTDPDDVHSITVGDGTNSFGNYYGPTSTIMQMAVDSLLPYGGTVYLKEGDYTYTDKVDVPDNVKIIGLSRRAYVNRPASLPAFGIQGSNVTISGITVKTTTSPTTTERAAIEIIGLSDGDTIENVTISDNELHATVTAFGVGFVPGFSNVTYRNINIDGNVFDSPSFLNPVYIGGSAVVDYDDTASASLNNVRIHNNEFKQIDGSTDGYALLINKDTEIESVRELYITGNHLDDNLDIGIDAAGIMIENLYVSNNSEFRNLYLDSVSGSIVENNVFTDARLDGYITDSQFNNNVLNAFTLNDTVNDFVFSGNTCFGKVLFKADNATSAHEIRDVIISNNKIHQDLTISGNLSWPGGLDHNVKGLLIENNSITMSLNFARFVTYSGGSSALRYDDLKVTGNIIGDPGDNVATVVDSINFGDGDDGAAVGYVYLSACEFSNNTMHGNSVFYNRVRSSTDGPSVIFKNNTFIGDKGIYVHGHRMHRLNIEENSLAYVDLFSDPYSYSAPETVNNITIRGNSLTAGGVIRLHDVTDTSGFVLNNCTVDDNVFYSTGSIDIMDSVSGTNDYTFNDMSVSGNKLPSGSIDIGGTLNSGSAFVNLAVKNNYVDGSLTLAGANTSNTHITGNFVSATLSVGGALSTSHVTDNSAFTMSFVSTVDGTVVSNNNVIGAPSGLRFYQAITDTTFASNNISGFLMLSSTCDDSEIIGNLIDCDPAGTGIVTFTGTMTRVTVNNNRINGELTSAGWSGSSFSNNSVLDDFTATSWSRCTFTDNLISNNIAEVASFGTLSNTVVSGSTFAGAVALTSLADESSFNNNTAKSTVAISSTIGDSSISGNNVSSSLTMTGSVQQGVISNNTSKTLIFSSTLVDSTVSGNVAESTDASVAFGVSDVTRSVISGNTFRSELSSVASAIAIGDLVDSQFTDNIVRNYSTQSITIGSLTDSSISSCNFAAGTLDINYFSYGALTDSTIDANFTITDITYLFSYSNVTGNVFKGSVTLTNNSGDASFRASSFSNNMITGAFSCSAQDEIMSLSNMNENTFNSTFTMDVTTAGVVHLAFSNSEFNDNVITGTTTFAGHSTKGTYMSDSTMNDNVFGVLSFCEDTSPSATFAYLIDNSVLSGNHVTGTATFGPATRSEPTYLGTSLVDNAFKSSLDINGFSAGCTIRGNTIDGATTLDELRGCGLIGNVFGADGTGDLTFTATAANDGGLKEGSIFSGNVMKGRTIFTSTLTIAVSASTISDNGFDGGTGALTPSLIISSPVVSSVINDNRFTDDANFDTTSATIDESSVSGNIFSAGSLLFGGAITASVIANNVLDNSEHITFSGAVGGGANGVERMSVSGNKCNTMTFAGDTEDVMISGNSVYLLTLTDASPNKIYIDIIANNMYQFVSSGSGMSYCTMTGNTVRNTVDIASIQRSSVSDNIVSGSFTITTTCQYSTINANQFNTNAVLFSGDVTNCGISDNTCLGTVTFATDVFHSAIGDNVFYNDFEITGSATGLTYTGNTHDNTTPSDATFNALTDCTIGDNQFAGDFAAGALTDTTVIGNVFANSTLGITITSLATSVFSDNRLDAGLTVSGAVSDSIFSGNTADSITFSYATPPALTRTVFTNNALAGALSITTSTGLTMVGNRLFTVAFSGNVNDLAMSGNYVTSTFTFSGSQAYDIAMSDNQIFGKLDFLSSVQRSSITGNSFTNEVDFSNTGSNAILDSEIVGNHISSHLTLPVSALCEQFVVANNHVGGNLTGGSTTGTYNGVTISGNTVDGTFDFEGRINDSSITGNSVIGAVTFDSGYTTDPEADGNAALENSVVSGNTFVSSVGVNQTGGGGTLLESGMSRTVFTDNFVGGAFDVTSIDDYGALYCIIANNTFHSSFSIDSPDINAVSRSAIIGNYISGTFTLDETVNGANTCDETVIANNILVGAVSIAPSLNASTSGYALDGCIVSGNRIISTLTVASGTRTVSVDTCYNSAISDNTIGGLVTLNGRLATSSFESNQMTNGLMIDNVNASGLNNNRVGAATLLGVVTNSRICDNDFVGVFSSGTMTTCTMSSNVFGSTFGPGALTTVTVGDNSFVGVATFGTLNSCTVSGNTFSTTMSTGTQTAVSMTGNTFSNDISFGDLADSTSVGNTFAGVAAFSDIRGSTVTANTVGGVFTCLILDDTTIASNTFDSTFAQSGGQSSQLVFVGNTIASTTTFSSDVIYSRIGNNVFVGKATFQRVDVTSFNSSVFQTSGTSVEFLGVFDNSTFIGSWVEGDVKFSYSTSITASTITGNSIWKEIVVVGIMSDSVISSNEVNGTGISSFTTISNSVISDNVFVGQITTTALTNVIMDGNRVKNLFSTGSGDLTDCNIVGNNFEELDLDLLTDTVFSDNVCTGAFASGAFSNVAFANNVLNSTFVSGNIVDSVVSDNVFKMSFTCAAVTTASINNNHFSGSFSAGTSTITNSTIGTNIFENATSFTSGKWVYTTCTGNKVVGTFTVTDTGTNTKCIDRVSFTGNTCDGAVTFGKTGAGGTDNFDVSTFTGNVFHAAVVFGTVGVLNEFQRFIFNSNSGEGSLKLVAGPLSKLDSSMIVGNAMTGAFTYDDGSSGTTPVPPTGTDDAMIALNWFGSYSGVAFDGNKAIGWGNSLTSVVGNGIVGSNITSIE